MTAPTLVKRRLTINFQRSVQAGKPQVMEVAIAPLTSPSSPNNDATLVGGTQTQDILLGNETNPAYFDLVPSDADGLTERLLYRVAWREKFMGRQFTQDIVMPDFDCDFDDLSMLSAIIGNETYLQWTDRMRAGGVAALNEAGQVVDAFGNPVTGSESAAVVQGNLDAEVVARMQGDQFLRTYFLQFAEEQISAVYRATSNNLAFEVNKLDNADLVEKTARIAGDQAIRDSLTGLEDDLQLEIHAIDDALAVVNQELDTKATLVNGKIPSDQIPALAIGNAVPVGSQSEMLALTEDEVQPGDLCVTPQGTYMLNGVDPSVLGNWVKLSDAAAVSSVNGQTGTVNLSAVNVGARPAGLAIPQTDITGLLASLNAKTDTSVTAGIHQRVTTLENDSTLVRTVGGVIPHAAHGADVAFLNVDGQIVNKAGSVINLGGGGGVLDINDVTGLQLALDGKVDKTDAAMTNARPPTPHAASHATGSADAITPASIGARALATPVPQADVSGLAAIISNNSLTAASNFGNRINALESAGPGSGGGGAPVKGAWFDAPTAVAPTVSMADFNGVIQKSPFGKNSSGLVYYNPAGAAEGESLYPYISPNGHLTLVQRNETNPPDPPTATASDLTALTTLVGTKAAQVDLNATNATMATRASQASLDATNTTVSGKASISQLSALGDVVATKANQSALDGTNTVVAGKAAQSALDLTNTTVAGKAAQSALDATNANVTALQTGKADLVAGAVPLGEIPFMPTSRVTGLDTQLSTINTNVAAKADQSALNATNVALNSKADLVGGMVPTAQLPSLAYTTTVPVGSKAAMLALSPTQVQPGDVCVITAGPDKGSYILNAVDPTQVGNWVQLSNPDAPVSSVNGQIGVVVLDAAAVGARPSGVPITQAEVTGLTTTLTSKADKSYVDTQLLTKPSAADVDTRISQSSNNKPTVALVATIAIPTLSGQQSIDGVLAPLGTFVLVTAQPSSINNGMYQVASGTWPRMAEMANGDLYLKGTQVIVTGGTAHHDSFWQQINASGIVGTNANNWTKSVTAGAPPTYTASLGVQKVLNDFRAQVVAGGGIQVVAGGLQIDPQVGVKKLAVDVPSGSTIVTVTHNLGTTDVSASFRDKASGDYVLVGWKPISINAISAEFDAPTASGQYRCTVMG